VAGAGLIAGRVEPEATTLGQWIERYISGRTDAKPTTATVWRRSQEHLLAYFGAARSLASITTADASEFRLWLLTKKPDGRGLCDNTARRTIGFAKQFLQRRCGEDDCRQLVQRLRLADVYNRQQDTREIRHARRGGVRTGSVTVCRVAIDFRAESLCSPRLSRSAL